MAGICKSIMLIVFITIFAVVGNTVTIVFMDAMFDDIALYSMAQIAIAVCFWFYIVFRLILNPNCLDNIFNN